MAIDKYYNSRYGKFHYVTNGEQNKHSIVFFTCMGINSSYYDFYNLYQELSESFNCIMVDLLGSGTSEQPLIPERTLENISQEIIDFINHLGLDSIYICCHSFSGIYILNSINSGQINPKINGLIGIDPSSPVIMKEYLSELSSNYDEAINSKKLKLNHQQLDRPDADVNPLLPDSLYKKCLTLYDDNSGNKSELSELENAPTTINKTYNYNLSNKIPSLCFISTLNAPYYERYGNPYFNENSKSAVVKLNGHHFLHWQHPEIMANFITDFIKSDLGSNK